jgi:RNA polymerase sigma factor (sigma-70 family)
VPEDPELLRRSVERPEVFEGIFERHYDNILRFARQRAGHDVGEDIAARTFEIAFARRASFDPAYRSARPWLLGICSNLIRHQFRDEQAHLRGLARLPLDPDLEGIDDPDRADAARLRPLVFEAIRELRPEDRDTFLLFALADASYQQISEALGVPVGTVRSRLNRARRILRERLGGQVAITSEMNDEGSDG